MLYDMKTPCPGNVFNLSLCALISFYDVFYIRGYALIIITGVTRPEFVLLFL